MRKIVFTLLISLIVFSANAQFRVGVKAGLNYSDMMNGSVSDILGIGRDVYDIGPDFGYHVGVDVQYMFTDHIGIGSGLYYSTLGFSQQIGLDIVDNNRIYLDFSANPSYLQLPLTFLYKFNLSESVKFYPSVGAYLGYGVAGKVKLKLASGYEEIPEELEVGGEEDYFGDSFNLNSFDMGLTGGINLDIRKFTIGVTGEYGLTDVSKADDGKKIGNLCAKLSVGYYF